MQKKIFTPKIIHYSTKYNEFNHYECNRPISEEFVKKLTEDPSFPIKYDGNPITVNKDKYIIDGQHRFLACLALKIPVAYTIDPDGNEHDIRIRNNQQNNWKGKNYLDYFSFFNEDYKIIKELRDKHCCLLTIISTAIKKICGYRNVEYHYKFKSGEITLGKGKDKLIEFIEEYIPAIKRARLNHGYERSSPYFTDTVVYAFCHFYLNDKKIFDTAIKKMPLTSFEFPHCMSIEKAREQVERLSRYRERKVKED